MRLLTEPRLLVKYTRGQSLSFSMIKTMIQEYSEYINRFSTFL